MRVCTVLVYLVFAMWWSQVGHPGGEFAWLVIAAQTGKEFEFGSGGRRRIE